MKITAEKYITDTFGDWHEIDGVNVELEPCPFCGGKPSAWIFDDKMSVECPECGIGFLDALPQSQAMDTWNRRV